MLTFPQLNRFTPNSQGEAAWGAQIVERVAKSFHAEFAEMTGSPEQTCFTYRAFASTAERIKLSNNLLGKIPWVSMFACSNKSRISLSASGTSTIHSRALEPPRFDDVAGFEFFSFPALFLCQRGGCFV